MVTTTWSQEAQETEGDCLLSSLEKGHPISKQRNEQGSKGKHQTPCSTHHNTLTEDVMLARQVLMNRVPSPNKTLSPPGCDGGDPWMIHKYLQLGGINGESAETRGGIETCWDDFIVV